MKKPRHLKVSYEAKQRWDEENPYLAPYPTPEAAEEWAKEIRAVHRDKFTVVPVDGGYGVEQDLP